MDENLPSSTTSSTVSTSSSSTTIRSLPKIPYPTTTKPSHPPPAFPVPQLSTADTSPNDAQSLVPESSGQVTGNLAPDISAAEMSAYDSLASQFNIIVLISTFSAGLIISFLSLSHDIINTSSSITSEVGMLLGFIALGFHLITAIVGGRAAMLCFRLSKRIDVNEIQPPNELKATLNDFYRYLLLCEQLQLLGTGMFTPAAMYMLYFMFNHRGFIWAIYAIAIAAGYLIYRLGFWKASVLWQNLEKCVHVVSCGFWGKGGEQCPDPEKGKMDLGARDEVRSIG